MAIYHLHIRNISRGDGRSVVAAAAYRAGETLPNAAEEGESAFGGRRDVLHAEIRLPAGAPGWMGDRARLWNAVEAAEKRKDARLAKEIEFALPRELSRADWLRIGRAMADAYTSKGHVADFAIHDDGSGHNPHVHLLLTTRQITADGFGGKLRAADGVTFVHEARRLWAALANTALGAAGSDARIDARANAVRGLERPAAGHRGPDKAERRAKRAARDQVRLQQGRAEMATHAREPVTGNEYERIETDSDRYPVPDPDGNPIAPSELDRAQRAMLGEMHAVPDDGQVRQPALDPSRVDDQSRYDAARIEDQIEDLAQERAQVFSNPELGEDERLDRMAELDDEIRAYEADRNALVGPGTPSQAGKHAWWRNAGERSGHPQEEPHTARPWWSRSDTPEKPELERDDGWRSRWRDDPEPKRDRERDRDRDR